MEGRESKANKRRGGGREKGLKEIVVVVEEGCGLLIGVEQWRRGRKQIEVGIPIPRVP